MKHIFTLLLFTVLVHFGNNAVAQDTELLDRDWFLNEMILSGASYPRTQNVDGSAFFNEDDMFASHPICKGGFGANIIYAGTDVFEIFEAAILLDFGCNPDATAFMYRHYDFYGVDNTPHNNPFDYVIEANGNEQMLTVTNANGDQAIYGTQPILSVVGFDKSSIGVYPNPAKNELFLNSKNNGNLTLKILNTAGKLLSTQKLELENQSSIPISQLATGIYFLNIEDENGNTTIKKFIKK